MNITTITLIVFSYLLGSISSAILISKIINAPDPRSYGSKNPGATNILRQLGIKIAATVIIFDILKGIIPVWIGYNILNITPKEIEITALASYLGHVYPIFFRFLGGKGAATAFGSFMAISIDISGVMITIWLLITLISGYVSLGTIITSFITSLYILWIHPKFTLLTIILSILILIQHYTNIIRLYKHQEQNIWKKTYKKKN